MMNWSFKRLFDLYGKPQAGKAVTVAPVALPSAPAVPQAKPWEAPFDIDGAYYRWIFDAADGVEDGLSEHEKRLLARIAHDVESEDTKFVPHMPHIIPQLLHSLDGEHNSIAQLARELSADPVLVASVIRRANSAAHHVGDAITSLEHAIAAVGEQGLRQIVSLAAFRPIINIQSGHHTKVAAPHIWEQTKYCAALSRSADRINAADPFRGYLAGLLPSIGLISVLRALDLEEVQFGQPKSAAFSLAAGRHASMLTARIAHLWNMPAAVTQSTQCVAAAGNKLPEPGLGRALYVGDQLSKARVMINARHLADEYDSIVEGLDKHTSAQYREFAYIAY